MTTRFDEAWRGALEVANAAAKDLDTDVIVIRDLFGRSSMVVDIPDNDPRISNLRERLYESCGPFVGQEPVLLFHYMSGADSEHSESFKADTGWADRFSGDEGKQRDVLERIASKYMGTHHSKGYTYTWLPNHLADGRQQVSPRSFLSALWRATQRTGEAFSGHSYALHWDAIRQGVQHASGIRVQEVQEDTPWVSDAIEPLRGAQVPIEKEEVIRRWEEVKLSNELSTQRSKTSELPENDSEDQKIFATGPLNIDYEGLIAELIDLGVMTVRTNKKLDLPDVYRIAFDIGRKGGVPRVKQQ